jgi:hypothetical protein
VYYVAIPAVLFNIVAQEEIGTLLNGQFALAFGGVVAAMMVVIYVGARAWKRLDAGTAIMVATVSVASNAAIIGLPLLHALFGHKAAVLAAIANIIVVALFTVQITLLEAAKPVEPGVTRTLLAPLKGALLNPVVLSTILGVAYAVTPWDLPTILTGYFDLLGGALAPCALFAIGMSIDPAAVAKSGGAIVFATAVKLIVLPVLVFAATRALGLDPLLSIAAVISAAMPTAKTEFILAKQYHEAEDFVAETVSVSTALAVVTLIGWLLVLSRLYPAAFAGQ